MVRIMLYSYRYWRYEGGSKQSAPLQRQSLLKRPDSPRTPRWATPGRSMQAAHVSGVFLSEFERTTYEYRWLWSSHSQTTQHLAWKLSFLVHRLLPYRQQLTALAPCWAALEPRKEYNVVRPSPHDRWEQVQHPETR